MKLWLNEIMLYWPNIDCYTDGKTGDTRARYTTISSSFIFIFPQITTFVYLSRTCNRKLTGLLRNLLRHIYTLRPLFEHINIILWPSFWNSLYVQIHVSYDRNFEQFWPNSPSEVRPKGTSIHRGLSIEPKSNYILHSVLARISERTITDRQTNTPNCGIGL